MNCTVFLASAFAVLGGASFAAAVDAMTTDPNVTMTELSVHQRYPWDGRVDIGFTFTCDLPDAFAFIRFSADYVDKDGNNVNVPMKTFDEFSDAFCTNAGTYHVTWNATADAPNLRVANLHYTITANMAKYMVVDLSKGTSATPENPHPVSYLETEPDPMRDDGGWTDEYKTTKMVFRLVQPGTYMMGWDNKGFGDWNDGSRHPATITRPYYLAVFECTQGQAKLVCGKYEWYSAAANDFEFMGSNRDLRPVSTATYNEWRGKASGGYCWPNHGSAVDPKSFIGRFRSQTGDNGYDMPTETEWEFAARAGHADAWGNDAIAASKNPDTVATDGTGSYTNSWLNTHGRYRFNGGYINNGDGTYTAPPYTSEVNGTAPVGTYKPNDWGFYDTLGNVRENTLDRKVKHAKTLTTDSPGPVVDDPSASDALGRSVRGGSFSEIASRCSLVTRYGNGKADTSCAGLRLCWHFPRAAIAE